MRELSKLESSASAMPPKFMGRDCETVMILSLSKLSDSALSTLGVQSITVVLLTVVLGF